MAEPEDFDVIGDLTVAAYVHDGFIDPDAADDGYVHELADTERRAREAQVWVAASDDEVVGVVTYCPLGSTYREIAGDNEGEFRALAVDPRQRGNGVGARLTEHCIDLAQTDGFGGVAICSMDRMLAAHHLYYRLGFQRDPSRDWSPAPGVDLWAFALEFA